MSLAIVMLPKILRPVDGEIEGMVDDRWIEITDLPAKNKSLFEFKYLHSYRFGLVYFDEFGKTSGVTANT